MKQIVKTKLEDNEVYGGAPSIRMLIFLHFFRLEIPIVDIAPDNIASESDWRKKNRFIYHNVASFIDVPLDSNYSPHWWCTGNAVPTENNGTSYVIHIRQTYTEERRLVRFFSYLYCCLNCHLLFYFKDEKSRKKGIKAKFCKFFDDWRTHICISLC